MTLQADNLAGTRLVTAASRLREVLLLGLITLMMHGCSLSHMSWHMTDPINKRSGVAVSGYDVVAYRRDGVASKGKKEFFYRWMGAEWDFVSAKNRNQFSNNPTHYAPEYGGYCAYSASKGITFYGDPKYWILKDDRLFLFFNAYTRRKFKEGVADGIIGRADTNWEKYYPKMP